MSEIEVRTLPPEFLPKEEKKKNFFWIIIVAVIILVGGGGVGAYFYLVSKNTPVTPPPAASLPVVPPPAPLVPEPAPEPILPPEPLPPSPTPPVLQAAPDSDGDGLTDDEEVIYKTNPQNPDTDADNFIDGNEVFKLYSPIAGGVAQLADSGLVNFFTIDKQNYSILYLISFGLDLVDATNTTKIAFTVGTGERFVVTAISNNEQISPLDYYLNAHPEVLITSISAFSSRGGFLGVRSPDGLETILSVNGKLYSFVYEVGGNITKRFAATYNMMINSFRVTNK